MPRDDNKQILQINVLSLPAINHALRRLSEMIYHLEGRSGPIALRDSIELEKSANPVKPVSGKRRIFVSASTGELSVLTSAGDVVSLETWDNLNAISIKEIVGKNLAAGMDIWPAGDATDPAHFLSGGTGVAIARETTTVKVGSMCIKITGGSTTSYIRQSLMETILPLLKGRDASLGAWVYASNSNSARLWIDDGVTKTYSDYHTGTPGWEWLDLTKLLSGSGTKLHVGLDTGAGFAAYLDGLTAVLGAVEPSDFLPYPVSVRGGTAHFPFAGDAATGTTKAFWGPGAPLIVESVHLEVGTAPTGAALIVDVNHWDGAAYQSMFSTRPQIAATKFAGEAAPDGTYRYRCFAAGHGNAIADARMGIDVDQVGSTVAGAGLHVNVRCKQYARPLDQFNAYNEHGV